MSFVKDDHGYTRGVGAIASMDAVSPARRLDAARGALAMARRDAVMSRHTLGRISTTVELGRPAPAARPPRPPRPAGSPRPVGPRAPLGRPAPPVPPRRAFDVAGAATGQLMVKSPGSVIAGGADSVSTRPSKVVTSIVSGGGTWGGGTIPPPAPVDIGMPSIEQLPDLPDEPSGSVAVAPPSGKRWGSLLVYAVLGAGALWLLSRE